MRVVLGDAFEQGDIFEVYGASNAGGDVNPRRNVSGAETVWSGAYYILHLAMGRVPRGKDGVLETSIFVVLDTDVEM